MLAKVISILWALDQLLEWWLPRTDLVRANSKWEAVGNVLFAITGAAWAKKLGTQEPDRLVDDTPTKSIRMPPPPPVVLFLAFVATCLLGCASTVDGIRKDADLLDLHAQGCFVTATAGNRAAKARVDQLRADHKAEQAVKDGEAYQGKLAMYRAGCERAHAAAELASESATALAAGAQVVAGHDAPGWQNMVAQAAVDLAVNIVQLEAFIAEVSK